MAGFSLKLKTIIFMGYFIISIIGASVTISALYKSTDNGETRCLSISDNQLIISKIFLILYIISTLPMLYMFYKMK